MNLYDECWCAAFSSLSLSFPLQYSWAFCSLKWSLRRCEWQEYSKDEYSTICTANNRTFINFSLKSLKFIDYYYWYLFDNIVRNCAHWNFIYSTPYFFVVIGSLTLLVLNKFILSIEPPCLLFHTRRAMYATKKLSLSRSVHTVRCARLLYTRRHFFRLSLEEKSIKYDI